jgi:hypothetical protein
MNIQEALRALKAQNCGLPPWRCEVLGDIYSTERLKTALVTTDSNDAVYDALLLRLLEAPNARTALRHPGDSGPPQSACGILDAKTDYDCVHDIQYSRWGDGNGELIITLEHQNAGDEQRELSYLELRMEPNGGAEQLGGVFRMDETTKLAELHVDRVGDSDWKTTELMFALLGFLLNGGTIAKLAALLSLADRPYSS